MSNLDQSTDENAPAPGQNSPLGSDCSTIVDHNTSSQHQPSPQKSDASTIIDQSTNTNNTHSLISAKLDAIKRTCAETIMRYREDMLDESMSRQIARSKARYPRAQSEQEAASGGDDETEVPAASWSFDVLDQAHEWKMIDESWQMIDAKWKELDKERGRVREQRREVVEERRRLGEERKVLEEERKVLDESWVAW